VSKSAFPVLLPSPRTFCSLAWEFVCVSLESATTQVCCKTSIHDVTASDLDRFGIDVIDNTDEYQQRRADLLAEIENPDCSACWSVERVGGASFRQKSALTELSKYVEATRDAGDASDVAALLAGLPSRPDAKFVQIKLGNPCDLKCVYCCAYYSSSWEAEDERAGITRTRERTAPPDVQQRFTEVFWQWFAKLKGTVREVEFIGGEPTVNASLYEALEKMQAVCADWDDESMPVVVLVTNLNTPRVHWDRLVRYIQDSGLRFRIQVSNESWGSRAEYIRSGLRWERFEQNFAELVTLATGTSRVELLVLLSLNALCVSSISQYLEWVRGHSETLHQQAGRHIGVFVNEVLDPVCLGIGVLPPRYAEYLDPAVACLKAWPVPEGRAADVHPRMAGAVEEAQNRIRTQVVDPRIARQFVDWLRDLDRRRNVDCRAVFPEYEDVLVGYDLQAAE
jgi:hypothetical protein